MKVFNTAFVLLIVAIFASERISFAQSLNFTDDKNQKQGYWEKKDINYNLIYKGKYKDNIPIDTFFYFYPSGKIKAIYYYSGNNVKILMFNTDSSLKSEGFYSDYNKKDSSWKYYDKNGVLISDEFYRNNMKHGVWKTYYNNGKVSEEIEWKNNFKDGIWNQYFDDGTKKLVAGYKNNLFHGLFKSFYPSGVVFMSGLYNEGLKEGKWLYFKETMSTLKIETFLQGKLIKEEILDEEFEKSLKEEK